MAKDMEYCGNPCLKISDNLRRNLEIYNNNKSILNAIASPVFITDKEHKIVYYNNLFKELEFINIEQTLELKTLKTLFCPLKHCIDTENSNHNADVTRCEKCILKTTIAESLKNDFISYNEDIFVLDNNKMMAVGVESKPIYYEGNTYILTSISDVTRKKKEITVSPIYNHDLVNVAGGLAAYLDVMRGFPADDIKAQIPDLKSMADKILDIALILREISRAEKDMLKPEILGVTFDEIIDGIKDKLRYNELDPDALIISDYNTDFELEADERLLMRVLGNLCINAIEKDKSAELTIDIEPISDTILFRICNKSQIPQEHHKQIFTFGFTTKGKGRGLGCYASRLIGTNVLKGNIWFESDSENGTIFYFRIPRICPEED